MAIDANAMYRAGFSSTSKGRNPAREKRERYLNAVGNQAYNILGTAVIGQVKKNYEGLQR